MLKSRPCFHVSAGLALFLGNAAKIILSQLADFYAKKETEVEKKIAKRVAAASGKLSAIHTPSAVGLADEL